MKYLLLLITILPSILFSQPRKKPTIYKDSIYFKSNQDTTFGTITYTDGQGTITGKGILIEYSEYEMHTTTPRRPNKYTIGKNGDTTGISLPFEMGSRATHNIIGCIRMGMNYKMLDCKYTFTPD